MKAAFNEDELRVIGKHTQFGIYGGRGYRSSKL